MSDLLSDDVLPVKRSTFLTVLCILTFIGSGYGIFSNAAGYFTADTTAATMNSLKAQKVQKSDQGAEFAQKMIAGMSDAFTVENIKMASIGGTIAAIFCLIGAIMMWQLKKVGFYSYVLGTIIGLVVPMLVFHGNIFAVMSTAVAGMFGIAFCVMYGVNLKDMK